MEDFFPVLLQIALSFTITIFWGKMRIDAIIEKKKAFNNNDMIAVFGGSIVVFILAMLVILIIKLALIGQ